MSQIDSRKLLRVMPLQVSERPVAKRSRQRKRKRRRPRKRSKRRKNTRIRRKGDETEEKT
jgi:hypothetical protein